MILGKQVPNLVLSLFYCSQSLFNMLIVAVCFAGLLAGVSWSCLLLQTAAPLC